MDDKWMVQYLQVLVNDKDDRIMVRTDDDMKVYAPLYDEEEDRYDIHPDVSDGQAGLVMHQGTWPFWETWDRISTGWRRVG